jgi:hypothetical protein
MLIYFTCNTLFSPTIIALPLLCDKTSQLHIKILCIMITLHGDYTVTDITGNKIIMISYKGTRK